jgi:hypothetical protein
VEEQILLAQAKGEKTRARPRIAPKIIKHSRIEYRDGRFQVKGDKLPLEKKIPEDLSKM